MQLLLYQLMHNIINIQIYSNHLLFYFLLKLMLDTWNESIFCNIKNRLQDCAMKLVHAERLGEAFDSQLVIGVRESYGKALIKLSHPGSVHMDLS